LYTNANEALSVRANFRTDNLQFYYGTNCQQLIKKGVLLNS
jgi:hypothetical protein